jgi:hypothetical protein
MMCRKIAHKTAYHARIHLRVQQKTTIGALDVYLCMKCLQWHVGHKDPRDAAASRAQRVIDKINAAIASDTAKKNPADEGGA